MALVIYVMRSVRNLWVFSFLFIKKINIRDNGYTITRIVGRLYRSGSKDSTCYDKNNEIDKLDFLVYHVDRLHMHWSSTFATMSISIEVIGTCCFKTSTSQIPCG